MMGLTRKGFNSKARANSNNLQEVPKEDVSVELNIQEEKYDSSNAFILLGTKKKKTKSPNKVQAGPKPLSNKRRKQLKKLLENKKKKINRNELLEKLSKVQAKPEDLKYFTSTSEMQTSGIKRALESPVDNEKCVKISNIKGSRKFDILAQKKRKFDPNIVGLEIESSSESESEDDDINMNQDEAEITVNDNAKDKVEINKNVESNGIANQIVNVFQPDKKDAQNYKATVQSLKIDRTPAVFIPVNRLPEVQAARAALPIFSEEQSLIEAIKENPVVIIHGETGSGKTTQVPQFLYEAGFTQNNKLIGITEPRRIAAMTMSARVGEELNDSDLVSYHIRYEKTINEKTKIKFMTEGVLLKEIRHDFLLLKYSVIIIDEAHERSVFSDVLIGLLSRIIRCREKERKPLKLIIMSATIQVEDFTENDRLFEIPPFLIRIGSRQHKVQVHFNMHTPENYVDAAFHKVCKIHQQLPPGAILVFLTGEKEIKTLCKMLKKAFPSGTSSKSNSLPDICQSAILHRKKKGNQRKKNYENDSFCSRPPEINLDEYTIEPLDTEELEHQLSDEECYSDAVNFQVEKSDFSTPLHVLPLYALLPFEEQEKVFKPPPLGSRLCVVSTNVAETSITIPGLKYVVDTGKAKTKVYDNNYSGVSKFSISWCSKASANQRAGRCGRTEGGHCYRLYSSAVFEHELPDFYPPEIKMIPVDGVLLQMKAIGIETVVDFPFPSAPDKEALKSAEKQLILLGALVEDLEKGKRFKDIKKREFSSKITLLGKVMSRFPLSPRFAKMLLLSYKHNCIPYIVAIVSGLTVSQVYTAATGDDSESTENEGVKILWKGIKQVGKEKALQLGDIMVLLRAVAVCIESNMSVQFCIKNGIRHKAMIEIRKMSHQLLREVNQVFPDSSLPLKLELEPPSYVQIEVLRKIITAGFIDHVARRLPFEISKKDKTLKNAYKCLHLEEPVFIHPSSILFDQLPDYVVYHEIIHTSKYYMRGVVEIDREWLLGFSPSLCNFSAPLKDPPPTYDEENDTVLCSRDATFGCWDWEIPQVIMEMPKGSEKCLWFCFFLLDGQVLRFFKSYRKHLLSCPSVMMTKLGKYLSPSRDILKAITVKQIDSRQSLLNAWKDDSTYLLQEFCLWIPQEKHMELELKWPPL